MREPLGDLDWYVWTHRKVFWNWNGREGCEKPVFGRSTDGAPGVTFHFGLFSIRYRFKSARYTRRFFVWYQNLIFREFPGFEQEVSPAEYAAKNPGKRLHFSKVLGSTSSLVANPPLGKLFYS